MSEVRVVAGNVRWERPTAHSFWSELAGPEQRALAALGAEQVFRAGAVLCREGDESSHVMIIVSGWAKVSAEAATGAGASAAPGARTGTGTGGGEQIIAVRGPGDVVGERGAVLARVRSATVTALDEVRALVVRGDRFAEFVDGHPRAAEVLERQARERREEDRARLLPGKAAGAERRLALLLLELAQRRGGYQQASAAVLSLPMSRQEVADWVGTSLDAVGRFLRSWRERGIVHTERRLLSVVDLDGLAAICGTGPAAHGRNDDQEDAAAHEQAAHEPHGGTYTHRGRPGHGGTSHGGTETGYDGSHASTAHGGTGTGDGGGRGGGSEPDALMRRASVSPDAILKSSLTCSVLITDVASFGARVRTDADRLAVRLAHYDILRSAFDESGVPWTACYHRDRGDGALIVVPPSIAPAQVVDPLLAVLAAKLRQHNRQASEVTRIQLRAALHVGPVGHDPEGLTGQALILAARIVDAPALKQRLAAAGADLVFGVSDYVFEHVISPGPGQVDPARFERVECRIKEAHVTAWIRVDGPPAPPELRPEGPGGLAVTGMAALPVAGMAALPVAAPVGWLPVEVRGRDGLLTELRRPLSRVPRRVDRAWVIAGMGGLGKSTVALAVAKTARARGWRVWWVRAADMASLTGGMLEVLRGLGAPESVTVPVREGDPAAPQRAWEFLNGSREAGRRWLLVFDGADNPAVLAAAGAATPADGTGWLRSDPAGMVIVTTRIRDPLVWGTGVVLRELRPLDEAAGAAVLRDLAPNVADPAGQQARDLARRLGGLPLALHLAGAYLASPFARWASFDGYRGALDSVELPKALGEVEEPGAEARATIQRSWDLSLDALAAGGRPQARQLLLVLSCYAPATAIPASLLLQPRPLARLLAPWAQAAATAGPGDMARAAATADPGGGGDDFDAERLRMLRDGLAGLSSAGLIDIVGSDGPAGVNAVTVHLVVADVNRVRLGSMDRAERVAVCDAAVALLEAATAHLDSARSPDWPQWRLLVPHINAALDLFAAPDPDGGVLGRLVTIGAAATDALLRSGRLAAAERLARSSAAAAGFAEADDPATLTARGALAETLNRHGRNAEAERLYRGLLTDELRVLGPGDQATLATRHDLARAIALQGRYTEAERLYGKLLTDQHRALGAEHPDTLRTRHSLARTIGLQGRYAEAERLCDAVLTDRRRVLGDTHPDTLATRHLLARMIGLQGRYAEAEELFRQVFADRRRVLGEDHPDTLASRHRLARMIGLQGRYAEAEEHCRQVLADRRRLLADKHPDNLASWHRLARIAGLQGRYAEAERLFRQVFADRRKVLGAEHPDTLTTGHWLGWMAGLRGRYTEAEELLAQVLGRRRELLGDDHPDTLGARDTLAWLIGRQGRYAEAERLCEAVLTDRCRVLGGTHPDTLASRDTLAWLTGLQGRYADAERISLESLSDRRRVLGDDHPETLATRHDLARIIGSQGRYTEAERLCRQVLAARRRVLGDTHPDTLASRDTLAWLARQRGRHAEAERIYRQVLAARRRALGADHPDTVATSHELAQLAAERGDTANQRDAPRGGSPRPRPQGADGGT